MKTIRIFNNNAVSAILDNDHEVIILGSGIGFNKRPGDVIDETKIEKIFHIYDEFQLKFLSMVENVSSNALLATEKIMSLMDNGDEVIINQGFLSLLDHVQFAIERAEQNIYLPNLMLSEIKMLYQKEFELGLKSLNIIKEICGVILPQDEAGYIALHFVNATKNKEETYDILKFVNGTLAIIKKIYDLQIESDGTDMLRLTLHLKLLAQRIFAKDEIKEGVMDEMLEYLVNKNANHPQFLIEFKSYVRNVFKYEINRQEEVYLLVHLSKILQNK